MRELIDMGLCDFVKMSNEWKELRMLEQLALEVGSYVSRNDVINKKYDLGTVIFPDNSEAWTLNGIEFIKFRLVNDNMCMKWVCETWLR